MPKLHKPLLALRASLAGLALAGATATAAAPALPMGILSIPLVSFVDVDAQCPANASQSVAVTAPETRALKSAAILGGEMSALDRIRLQQSGARVTSAAVATVEPAQAIAPTTTSAACLGQISSFSPRSRDAAFTVLDNENFLASTRIAIRKTSFDRQWRRVSNESVSKTLRLEFGRDIDASVGTVQSVNSWVNREIAFVDDRKLFGRGDYWAGARLTLALGKGDCEDIALTKMQLLAAAGFKRSDMFLTIARDTVRNADHALLVVRMGDRFLVLDNATDTILDGAYSHDYLPVLSFSGSDRWVHGRKI
ncbi:transglutaminase-like cysteine peptidase [Erythrobacter sp. GH1-10]|uniref:transglutaminase-like cysteine peptidase n=1 Tax=Erythrobacter sp. GH1-10 TaxID=3349334 RepID=UPI003877B335